MVDVDIFVGSPAIIDFDVFELWLNGYSAHEASRILQSGGVLQEFDATFEDLFSDTMDHYRAFNSLEYFLKFPTRFSEQTPYQLEGNNQQSLIDRYYHFDDSVMRELLGKKLSSRNRKDLDDISERTHCTLKSCRRQFDNMKRVFKTVEEMKGSLVENIQINYLLCESLARKYAAVVFITNHHFETGKKKLSYLTLGDFLYCANQMIINWSYSAVECQAEDMDVDLDRNFLHELRDLKILIEKDVMEEHKFLVLQNMKQQVSSEKVYLEAESNFKTFSKALVNIASGLNNSREVKDIFIDIVEKFIEPLQQLHWRISDAHIFLVVYKEACHQMAQVDPHMLTVWERYMNTITSSILKMHHT